MRAHNTADEHTVLPTCQVRASHIRTAAARLSHAHRTDVTSSEISCKTSNPDPPFGSRPILYKSGGHFADLRTTRQSDGRRAKLGQKEESRRSSWPQAGQHTGRGDVDAAVRRHGRDLAAGAECLARDDHRLAEDGRACVRTAASRQACSGPQALMLLGHGHAQKVYPQLHGHVRTIALVRRSQRQQAVTMPSIRITFALQSIRSAASQELTALFSRTCVAYAIRRKATGCVLQHTDTAQPHWSSRQRGRHWVAH